MPIRTKPVRGADGAGGGTAVADEADDEAAEAIAEEAIFSC
jgi:hypothetical protein